MYPVEPPQEPSGEVARGDSGDERSRLGSLGSWAMNAKPGVGNARSARRCILKIEKLDRRCYGLRRSDEYGSRDLL